MSAIIASTSCSVNWPRSAAPSDRGPERSPQGAVVARRPPAHLHRVGQPVRLARADPGTGCSAATASSGWGRVMTDRNQSESEPVDIKRYAGGKWDGNLLLDPEFDDDLPPLVEIKRLVS